MVDEYRPSPSRVYNVSWRYLKNIELQESIDLDRFRLDHEDLSLSEIFSLPGKIMLRDFKGMFSGPFHDMREAFLVREREREGLAPGQELIAVYAINKCHADGRFQLVESSNQLDKDQRQQ